ncbi:diguanylate cyclase [Sesbania bispinosa]|nr:diguanylate cyclase [Sesbania bispinosa]
MWLFGFSFPPCSLNIMIGRFWVELEIHWGARLKLILTPLSLKTGVWDETSIEREKLARIKGIHASFLDHQPTTVRDAPATIDVYGPWMVVQQNGRKKQGGSALNAKIDSMGAVKGGGNVAKNLFMSGSRFAALASNLLKETEANNEAVDCTHVVADSQKDTHLVGLSHVVKAHEIKNKKENIPTDSDTPQELVATSDPNFVFNIRKSSRSISKAGPTNLSLETSLVTNIPVSRPVSIPDAKMCVELDIEVGVLNFRPPDPLLIANKGIGDPGDVVINNSASG